MGIFSKLKGAIGTGVEGGISGGISGAISGGIMGLFKKDNAKQQMEQQRKLMEMQRDNNMMLMRSSYGLQREMYDHTFNKNTPSEQRRLYEEAGMNPALAYSQGAIGSPAMGSGGASVGGGAAANEAELQNAQTNRMGMALQMGMMRSQIKVNESVAEKNAAEAEKVTGEAKTIESQRDILLANLKEANQSMFIENMRKQWEDSNTEDVLSRSERNFATDRWHDIEKESIFNQQVTTAIIKTQAEIGNTEAQALLTNKKAQGYYQELLNATKQADNDGIKAAAMKLASEWSTGEFTNWKTWVNVAADATKMVGDVAKIAM